MTLLLFLLLLFLPATQASFGAVTSASAAFPGKPGIVVFNLTFHNQAEEEQRGGLYSIHPGHNHPRQLTTDPWDYSPSFSPSGQALIFRRATGSRPGLYTIHIASGKTTRLTSRESDLDPSFGSNGMIIFSRFVAGRSYDLFLRTADGQMRRLTSSSARDENPVFTPNGKSVIFIRNYERPRLLRAQASATKPPEIYSIRTSGADLRLVGTAQGIESLDVSPNGRNIAAEFSYSPIASVVRTMPLNGGGWTLISKNASQPAYSPSGDRIVYSNFQGTWSRRTNARSDPMRIFRAEYMQGQGSLAIEPTWQPLPQRCSSVPASPVLQRERCT